MLKKLIAIGLLLGMVASGVSCSSSKDKEEPSDVAAVDGEEDEGDDFGDDDLGDDESEGGDLAEGDDDLEGDDLDGDEGEDLAGLEGDDAGDDFSEGEGDDFADGSEGGDEFADAGTEESSSEPLDDGGAVPEPEETAGTTPIENLTGEEEGTMDIAGDETMDMGDEEPVKKWVPVKKIKETPYDRAGVLVNAVYLARPDDSLASVSQKVLGREDEETLLKVNPHLARGLKTGDKVYYNSPQRPDDRSQILTFYEDAGLAPEVYTAQAGENIREASMKLLGDANSWKEIWATNAEVESKGILPEETRLRYWSSVGNIAAMPTEEAQIPPPEEPVDVAANTPPPPEPMDMPPPPTPEPPSQAPPPPPQAGNSMPPPPEPADLPPPPTQASIEPPPPPPPPPPAPRKKFKPPKKKPAASSMGSSQDNMMVLIGGAILIVAAVVLFVVIRKKKARRAIDFNTSTQTQIE